MPSGRTAHAQSCPRRSRTTTDPVVVATRIEAPSEYWATSTAIKKGSIMARGRYGLLNFAVDVILVLITGGLWLIWIFVREMRR